MILATIFLQKEGQRDDIITFHPDDNGDDIVWVKYRDGTDSKNRRTVFYLHKEKVSDYVSDILFGLRNDSEPFEFIQVMTAIGPSILYHIVDLDDQDVRANIRTTISGACSLCVRYDIPIVSQN